MALHKKLFMSAVILTTALTGFSFSAMAQSGYGQLPAYSYNPDLDPRQGYVYGKPETQPASYAGSKPYMGLETRSGFEVGLSIANYRYREPGINVTTEGPLYGATFEAVTKLGQDFFLSLDTKGNVGWLDYTGSGTASGEENWILDVRGLIGKDFVFEQFSLSPYAGFGYRYLHDDARGLTSTNAAGYRRSNQLYYIPIGIHPRTHIDSNARLSATLEYDLLIQGTQKSYLSDAGFGDPDIVNLQKSGYGLRGDIMYETSWWSVGPYFNFWSINTSNQTIASSPNSTCGGTTCVWYEPYNHTVEAGVQLKLRWK
ncbi:MAG: hypothetical protein AB7H77_06170 [Bdellovibrionales bacterium]